MPTRSKRKRTLVVEDWSKERGSDSEELGDNGDDDVDRHMDECAICEDGGGEF